MINPVESVTSGRLVYQAENADTIAECFQNLSNPFIKATATIIQTESGYTVIIPPQNIGAPKIEVEKLGNGDYLVKKTPIYYGAKTEKIIMSEEEFIKHFNGIKTKHNDKKVEPKKMIDRNPYNYFRTRSGYVIKLLNGNNITGASIEVEEQTDGTYLVTSYAYPGSKANKEVLSERELIAKYNGEKIETQKISYNMVA